MRTKKELWRVYLLTKQQENHEKYKQKQIKVKQMITEAKRQTWKQFGIKMEKDNKINQIFL